MTKRLVCLLSQVNRSIPETCPIGTELSAEYTDVFSSGLLVTVFRVNMAMGRRAGEYLNFKFQALFHSQMIHLEE